jgi:4-methylaminobutanoate oxidase (formaldehyde-forming)
VDVTAALSKGARTKGASIVQGVKATGLKRSNRRIVSVITDSGEIETHSVVDCGGIWGRDIAAMAGQSVSLLAAEGLVNLTPYWRSESW